MVPIVPRTNVKGYQEKVKECPVLLPAATSGCRLAGSSKWSRGPRDGVNAAMVKICPVQEPPDLALVSDGNISGVPLAPKQWLQPDSVKLFATADDGPVIGAILLLPDRRLGELVLSYKLAWLRVAEGFRRQGVASALLRCAARHAAQAGAKYIVVSLRPSNAEGIALLENLGPTGGAPLVVHLTHGGY